MNKPKVFYHTGSPCQGCSGIGDMWRKLNDAGTPFAVYSVEGGGLIAEAAQYVGADPLVYRTLATDVAAYDLPPNEAAAQTWQVLMEKVPPEIKALKDRVWLEIGNEPDKNRADWLGWYYVELAGYVLANGYRMSAFAWSTGEPEPEHWQLPGVLAYLKLAAANPSRLAVSVHEYSLSADDIMEGFPWLVGRVQFLFDTCNTYRIKPPTVFVTELGWTHNDLPPFDIAQEDIERAAALYAQYPTVKAAFLWTLIGGGDKKTLAAELNALMPWLTDFTLTTTYPEPDTPPLPDTPPPDNPPTEPPIVVTNLLLNGSFERGWSDADTFPGQHPTGWEVVWNTGDAYDNPHSEWPYLLGEGVHKMKAHLPENERDVFIWDGDVCYKLFAGQRAFWARLKQALDLPAGKYRLSTPVWVDAYHGGVGAKDYNVDVNQAQIMVKANGQTVRDWTSLPSGGKRETVTEWTHGGGACAIAVHLRMNWPINNNFFLDDWSLTPVVVTPPPPPPPPPVKHQAVVVKLPQGATVDEWRQAAEYAWGYQHTITASNDDMLAVLNSGNVESYAKVAWPNRQEDSIAMLAEAGYRYEPLFNAPPPPPQPPVVDDRPVEGVDVSKWNGVIDWKKLKDAGN